MTLTAIRFAAMVLVFVITSLPVAAQTHTQAQRIYSQAELDQMLAPVALYPDQLLSQVLMAATYPLEVSEAARWSRDNPDFEGDGAVSAAQSADWDPSVQSLVAFPQILARMDENPDWTHRLGEAFLAQEPQVMDTVQQLRRRAQTAGKLQSGEQMFVQQQGQAIVVQSVSPQYVYVPYYDPLVIYGPWWWPAYQPMVWAPWTGYARPYRPGDSVGFWWGRPVRLSVGFFFGNFDWHHRQVRVVHPTTHYYRPPVAANRAVVLTPHRWEHERRRREFPAERRQLQVHQQIPMQFQVHRQEHRVAISSEPQEHRFERHRERPQSRPQIQQEQRARMPEAVAARQLPTPPGVQPQRQARPQAPVQQERRPRIPDAHAPQQSRRER